MSTLEQILADHTRVSWSNWPFTCTCEPSTSDSTTSHDAHLADRIREWLLSDQTWNRAAEAVRASKYRAGLAPTETGANLDDANDARAALTAALDQGNK